MHQRFEIPNITPVISKILAETHIIPRIPVTRFMNHESSGILFFIIFFLQFTAIFFLTIHHVTQRYPELTIYTVCLCDQRRESLVSVRATSPCERNFRWRTIYQISLTWHWSTRRTGHGAFSRAPSAGFEPTTIVLRVETLNR